MNQVLLNSLLHLVSTNTHQHCDVSFFKFIHLPRHHLWKKETNLHRLLELTTVKTLHYPSRFHQKAAKNIRTEQWFSPTAVSQNPHLSTHCKWLPLTTEEMFISLILGTLIPTLESGTTIVISQIKHCKNKDICKMLWWESFAIRC